MAEQIVIAELQINTKSLLDSNTKLIQQIALLKAEQKDLQSTTKNLSTASEEQSRKFIENDAALKSLNSEYSTNKKVLSEAVTGVAGLNEELGKEAKSVYEATNQNTKLNIIKKQITTSTQAGRDAIEEINIKLDQNTEYIKANSSETEKQKMNIGNYKDSIKGALAELNPFNGGLSGFMERSQAAGGTGKLLTESFKGIMTGVKGATMAAWEFIATPIGAIIAAIVLVATLLYDIFKNFAPVINPIKDAMAALGAVFEVVKSSIFALITGTKSLGEVFSSFTSEAGKAADEALRLAQAQRDVVKADRELELSTAKAQAEITKLITQSKNRTLSEEERMGMLNKAIKLEEESVGKQLKVNNQKIANARLVLAEGKTISEEDMVQLAKGNANYAQSIKKKYNLDQAYIDDLRKLQVERYGIEEASSRVIEKANNFSDKLAENKAKKEEKAIEDQKKAQEDAEKAKDKAIENNKKRQDKEIQEMNDEVSLFIAKENLKSKTLEQSIAFEETSSQKRIAILDKEYAYGKISKAKYDEDIITITNETALKQTQLLLNHSKAELDLFISENVSKLDSKKLLSQALIDEESKRLESIKLDKLNLIEQEKKTNQDIIDLKIANNEELSNNDIEFLTAKNNLESEFRNQNKANQDAFDEQVKQQKASQLQAQNEIDLANSQTELEQRLLNNQIAFDSENLQLQEALNKKLLTQQQYDDKVAISKRKLKVLDDYEKASQLKSTIDLYSGLGNAAQGLFGKSKALSTALALADTYASANKAYYSQFLPIPTVDSPVRGTIAAATAVLGGLANVASINKIKFEKGGLQEIGGNRHSDGGTKFVGEDGTRFEAEQGELIGVMNRNAARAFMNFNNAYPSGSSITQPNVFASGGIVTQQSFLNPNVSLGIDYDLLAMKISQANMSLPSPVVAVTDINYGQGNYAQVVAGANH
jgi:hypothetical protein